MANLTELKNLGEVIRNARKARKMSLEDVADLSGIKPSYLWIIEKAYTGTGRKPTIPSDKVLKNLSDTLNIPLSDFHAALGRHNDSAASLIREQIAEIDGGEILPPEAVEELGKDVAKYARWEVERMLRQYQEQSQQQSGGGKQGQRQKQVAG